MKISTVLIAPLIALYSCAGGDESSSNEQSDTLTKAALEVCTYSYNPESTEISWVAYKFTERKGVPGKFDSISITGFSDVDSPEMIMNNASFELFTNSTNTGDAARDPKIKDKFFGSLTDGGLITGKVLSVTGDAGSGNVSFSMKMNGVEKAIEGTYTIVDGQLEMKAEINVDDWMAQEAIAALNLECKDLHKGIGGSSKLWPEVSIFMSTKVEKNCK